jgi:pimeloyl-ACP methyl ester carboxylesterase
MGGNANLAIATGQRSFSARWRPVSSTPVAADYPLVVALHGGTYTSAYFDVPGYSLLARAESLGIPVVAIDRPGYGSSTPLAPDDATHDRNAECLDAAIGALWQQHGAGARGVVLIGHSIGGAIATLIATRQPAWPLLGLAVSGVGLNTMPGDAEAWAQLPNTPTVTLPPPLKDIKMFGAPDTFDAGAPAASRCADAPAPRRELIAIVSVWHQRVHQVASRVTVPLHYRQAAQDQLWVVNAAEVAGFGAAFKRSPRVDTAIVAAAGHCIDFHRRGAAFQLEQLAFAMACAAPG